MTCTSRSGEIETAELALIGLGSNQDGPLAHLRGARGELEKYGKVESLSSIYRTVPVGGPPAQPDYLNAVVALTPAPSFERPASLLAALLEIERRHGRRRRLRWEARPLDLDLLAFGALTIAEPGVILPHPRLLERPFVLIPLCEAVPGWRHPVTGQSACMALGSLSKEGVVRTDLAWTPG